MPSLGGSMSLPITSEEWNTGAYDPKYCGSNGTVQVKCTKLNGKPFERIIVPHLILGQPREIKGHFLSNSSELNQGEENFKSLFFYIFFV